THQRADAGGGRGTQVGDVVDLVFVQADALHQGDLDLVAGGDAPYQVVTATAGVLGHGQYGGDVVARVGVVGGQERVVEVQLPDGHPVGPGGPLRGDPGGRGRTHDRVPGGPRMSGRLCPCAAHRPAAQGRRGHCGVVDDAVTDHLHDLGLHPDRVGRHGRDMVRQPFFLGWSLGAAVYPNTMLQHAHPLDTVAL